MRGTIDSAANMIAANQNNHNHYWKSAEKITIMQRTRNNFTINKASSTTFNKNTNYSHHQDDVETIDSL